MKRILSIVLTLALLLTALPLALSISAAETVKDYTFSDYKDTSKTTWADRKIDDYLTIDMVECSYNTQFRLYAGKGIATFKSTYAFLEMTLRAKGNSGTNTLAITGSTDGANWEDITTLNLTSSLADYTVTIPDGKNYTQIKLTAGAGKQVQITTASISYGEITGGSETPTCEHTGETSYGTSDSEHWLICSDCNQEIADSRTEHNNTEIAKTDSSCTSAGSASYICDDCEYITEEIIPAKSHDYTNGNCSMCGATAVFEFGENGDASHNDGSSISEYTETVNGYTLTLTDLTKVYGNAHDALGNSCLKLGTGSAIGSFTFTVPTNVTTVIIKATRYKSYDAATVNVNGTNYPLTKTSDSGEYDEITVDTSTTKTVTFATTTDNDERAMVNFIAYIADETPACTHENQTTTTENATYLKNGLKVVTCDVCGEELSEVVLPAATAAPVVYTSAFDAATNKLTINWTYSDDFVLDIDANTTFKLFYKIGDCENTVDVPYSTTGGSVTFEGFNAARLNDTLYFGLTATITDVDAAKFNEAAEGQVVASNLVEANSDLGKLMAAINSATDEAAVVAGQVKNTATLVSNTIKADLKAGTVDLRFVASQTLIEKLDTLGKVGRTVKLFVLIEGLDPEIIEITTLRKVTMVSISGMSFEQLNGEISVQLSFEYPNASNSFNTDAVTFHCDEIIANADTDVANAFTDYMN